MDANRIPKATYFAKIVKVSMQTCPEKSQQGVLFCCRNMFWYSEVGFAVLEWDSVFCSSDMKRLLNLFLVPALKRQHKNNFCMSIILPLCRLQQEPNSSAFPTNIASAFRIHFLLRISPWSIYATLLTPFMLFFLALVSQSSSVARG